MNRSLSTHPRGVRIAGLLVCVCVLALAGTLQSVSAAANYVLIDLGALGAENSNAFDINDAGQVVGLYYDADSSGPLAIRSFLWENGVMTDLGDLGGADSYAYAINNAGQVVGFIRTTGGQPRAFLWENGVVTDLGDFGSGYSYAHDINDAGQVVGLSYTASAQGRAFLWENGVMTDLGDLGGGFSAANAINDAGQVVGYSTTASGDEHAFLWDNGVMTDLGTLGDTQSHAESINNAGQVVGVSFNPSTEYTGRRAFLWENGVMTELGLPGDATNRIATDINDSGQVVGYFVNASGVWAFVWENGTTTILLPFSGGAHTMALGINDAGHIVGNSGTPDSHVHAFLAIPASPVNNAPVVAAGPDAVINEGSLFSQPGSFSDGDSSSWSATVDYGDGSGVQILTLNGLSFTLQHLYGTPGAYTVTVQVTDDGGAAGSDTVTVTVLSPQEAVEEIISEVEELVNTGSLNKGQGNALTAKLEAALDSLNRGNTKAAINQLEAFISQVQALVDSGALTPEEAQPLLDAANALIALLEA